MFISSPYFITTTVACQFVDPAVDLEIIVRISTLLISPHMGFANKLRFNAVLNGHLAHPQSPPNEE